MDFIIVTVGACLIFGLCFSVFYIKARRSKDPVKLHRCGQGDGCRCKTGEIEEAVVRSATTLREKQSGTLKTEDAARLRRRD